MNDLDINSEEVANYIMSLYKSIYPKLDFHVKLDRYKRTWIVIYLHDCQMAWFSYGSDAWVVQRTREKINLLDEEEALQTIRKDKGIVEC